MSEEHPPDRRKHGYKELEEKLEAHYQELEARLNDNYVALENRFKRFVFKAIIAFAILGVSSAIGLFGFGIVLKEQNRTSDRIQQQRYDSLTMSCRQQNERHNNTIFRTTNALPLESQETVRLLVDALQPYVKDCNAYAKTRVKGTG